MKKMLTILGFLFISIQLFSIGNESKTFESLEMYSNILGQNIKYSICLPAGYDTSKDEYPVVYLLHGLGDNETAWVEYGRISQIADKAVEDGEIVPMIFVIPQGFRGYYVNFYDGSFNYQDMFIQELIPYIESNYRVKNDRQHRATIGYSMGGYGALILPLMNPDVFSACVPLSISVRTDEQYMTEDPKGWDDQWGRIFGGVGTYGEDRITEYYKQNSPFHIVANADPKMFSQLNIYIDNGDDEQTLAFSNEELHILLRDKNIPHEFRVRNGGHEFRLWREALTNGLRYLSDAFENKPYRGDIIPNLSIKTELNQSLKTIEIAGKSYEHFTPIGYESSSRLYPVLYIFSDLQKPEKEHIITFINELIETTEIPALEVLFIPSDEKNLSNIIIPSMENEFKARKGFRFRAIIGIGEGGENALISAMNPEQFTSCAIFDASGDYEKIKYTFLEIGPKSLERTWFYIDNPDKGPNYSYNGKIHMLFREKSFYHEYRVSEGEGGFPWLINRLEEALKFTANKIHR